MALYIYIYPFCPAGILDQNHRYGMVCNHSFEELGPMSSMLEISSSKQLLHVFYLKIDKKKQEKQISKPHITGGHGVLVFLPTLFTNNLFLATYM